jgi:hypothetical protein
MIQNDHLNLFLQETFFCDFQHPDIQKVAGQFASKYQNKKELAVALFNFVRDEIKYTIGPWDKKASETLHAKRGMCTTCSNLLIALFRAVGIPAGYCIYTVVGGESFGHLVPSFIKKRIHKHSVHIVCYVYLNSWLKCDPSTDQDLSRESKHISRLTELVEWNGETDAVHNMDQSHILNISEPLPNIDFQFRKKPRYIVRKHIFHIGNFYIDFLRNQGKKIHNKEEVDLHFRKWLRTNQPYHYYRYILTYYIYGFFQLLNHLLKKRK